MSSRSTTLPAAIAGLALTIAVSSSRAPAQTAWTPLSPAESPSARTAHSLVYHEGLQRTALFGGCDDASRCFDELWLFDGSDWTLQQSGGPAPRFGHAMVYDPVGDRLVLFGGGDTNNQLFGDTWEWKAGSWKQLAAGGPSPRWNHAMAYDPVRYRVVLFGGNDLTTSYDDTWEWDGVQWSRVNPQSKVPFHRMGHAMAWDGNSGEVLLIGGFGFGVSSIITSDTWSWDGRRWAWRSFGAIVPTYAASAAWDAARERVVLSGGISLGTGVISYLNRTREWDGFGWIYGRRAVESSGRAWAPIAFDSARAKIVRFGGTDDLGAMVDTQEYGPDDPATYVSFGGGCGVGAPILEVDAEDLPWVGQGMEFRLKNMLPGIPTFLMLGASRTQWGPLALPFSPGPISVACPVLVSHDIVVPLLNVNGQASFAAVMPPLVGATFYLQGLAIYGSRLAFSDAGCGTIGSK